MSTSPVDALNDIRRKIDSLAAQRDKAAARANDLSDEAGSLRNDLSERDKQLDKALLEVEFLSLSHRLADSPQALADARRKIKALIRKIDAAIALIKTDPGDL